MHVVKICEKKFIKSQPLYRNVCYEVGKNDKS